METHPEFGPNSVSFRSVRIENSEQLDKSLGVSASASVNAGYAGGSASAAYSNSLSVSSYSLSYLVEVAVAGKGNSIRDVKLKDQFRKLISTGNDAAIARFRAVCGDGYIGEFTMGGGFQSFVQIHTRSATENEKIAASLSASYGMASGAASFSNALKKVAQSNEFASLVYRGVEADPFLLRSMILLRRQVRFRTLSSRQRPQSRLQCLVTF